MSRLAALYRRSPVWVQNLGVTGHGLRLYLREYGPRFTSRLAEFDERQWRVPAELRAYQDNQLRLLIEHCFAHVPYYRRVMNERGILPADVQSINDLPKLPLLTREMVREHAAELRADNIPRWRVVYGHTNGTTGSPLTLVWERRTCLIKNVVDWRQKCAAGVHSSDRMAFFLGQEVVPATCTRPPFWRSDRLRKQVYYSSHHLCPENLDAYVRGLTEFQTRAIEGYPSTMYILARLLLRAGRTVPLTAVFTSSEVLLRHQREAIESAFGCSVFDFYGMAERVVFATECLAHRGKHLNTDFGITEIIGDDGRPAAPGHLARIVATGLHNYAMPLIRYQTGDVTSAVEAECSCGRGFPLIGEVAGRDDDIITTPDGRYLSPNLLGVLIHGQTQILESQFIQDDRKHLRVHVVHGHGSREETARDLQQMLHNLLGESMSVGIEFVEEIPRTKGGKFRFVLSRVPLGL